MDYSHAYHAGNVGDVWKHCALLSCLAALKQKPVPLFYLETHAGAGQYLLGSTGEWTEGAGKLGGLLLPSSTTFPSALVRYSEAIHRFGMGRERDKIYPGSPVLASCHLGPGDHLFFYELVDATREALADNLAQQASNHHFTLSGGDGLAALRTCLNDVTKREKESETLVLIDPAYSEKQEWLRVPTVLAETWREYPNVHFLLWYPIKSLTRPDAMLKCLRETGMPATALDLITTPLDHKRNRLNGSGLILVNPPSQVVMEMVSAATVIGELCATHGGRWYLRANAWGAGR